MAARRFNRLARLALVAAAGLALAACSGFDNQGGATTCADYLDLNTDDRVETIKQMIEERGETVSSVAVTVASASVLVYCSSQAEPTAAIVTLYDR
jgi:hypothetical protein